jgi:arginine repressor
MENIEKQEVQEVLIFTHSASLRYSNRMVSRNVAWRGDRPLEWASSTYWLPEVHIEMNVWDAFLNRFKAVSKGKTWSKKEIGTYCRFTDRYDQLLDGVTCQILTQSATELPLPDNSIDTIITDPPYGNNVLYAELCNFYWAWVGHLFGREELIDDTQEAVVSKEHKKTLEAYRSLLYEVFKECYRVLKRGRWMVMTFHNKEFQVWNAIHLAAHDAGFILPEEDGMIYQSPIQQYTRTIQQRRSGSMLGDFILSFQKAEKPPEKKIIPYVEIEKRIQELAAEAVLHHKGASLSTIYMKIMPFLLNSNLLEKVGEKDLPPYLKDSFEERDGKWYLKEKIGDPLRDYLSNYSKSYYKEDYRVLDFIPVEARLEYLIRRLLYKNGYATQDEIQNEIYSNLINSNAAEVGEISRVLNRIARLVPGPRDKRKVWRLKEDIERQEKLDLIEEKVKEIVEVSEESEHDLVIRRLVELGAKEGYASHIGKTEQKKYVEFKSLSLPMANNVQYGMDKKGFEIVTEIDVLWLKGDTIVSAFEVEKTTTIDSGINRFRNLFAIQPNTTMESYIVIPNKRKKEAEKKLSSPANVKNGLTQKIGYILFDDLDIKGDVQKIDFSKIRRKVE